MSEHNSSVPPPRTQLQNNTSATLKLTLLWEKLPNDQQLKILRSLTRMIQQAPPLCEELNDE